MTEDDIGSVVKAIYGAFAEHEIFYIVEADDIEKIQKFLSPGFRRCTSRVTPVAGAPIVA